MAAAEHDELRELLKEVRRIEVQSARLVTGVMAGGYASVFRGAGIEFHEVREYVPGDDPRSVDWNVTARIGRPFVKKYIDERELTVLFVLDLSASMRCGLGVWSARQAAARVCACLALSAVRSNDKVGLVAFSSEVDKFVPPKKGRPHALRIVRDCLALEGRAPTTDLERALDFVGHAVRRRTVLFVLSDFLATGYERELARCAERHDVVAVRLAGPELEPPARGLWRLRDPETGAVDLVDWRARGVRGAFAERVGSWRRDTEVLLRRAGVDLMDVPIPRRFDKDAIARPILSFFRMRERRAAKR